MCGSGTLIHDNGLSVDLKVPWCDTWGCETCAPRRKARLEMLARRGRPNRLLTITGRLRPDETPIDMRKRMSVSFAALMKRINRHLKKKAEALVITEATQQGWPHFHVLLRSKFISQKLLKKWWEELTGDFMVDIRKVKNGAAAARYVAKYIGKAPHKFGNCKRYWKTKNYDLGEPTDVKVKVWEPKAFRFVLEYRDDVERGYLSRRYWRVPGEVEPGVIRLMWPGWGTGPPPQKAWG